MKKLFTICMMFFTTLVAMAGIQDDSWNHVAVGQPDEWYATDEAKDVAENVLLYQKNNGGWMKNIEMHHPLSASEKAQVTSEKSDHSCFDNYATTTEMRFLAKMYKHIKDERYRTAFNAGLKCIMDAQFATGGWPQYWPLRSSSTFSYSDYITFNDDLMINMLKMLNDVYKDEGDFADIVDAATSQKAKTCYDKGLKCVLDCQVEIDGKKTFWGAQHDQVTMLPSVGRPHELPSFSGSEGANVFSYLMSLPNPSAEVRCAVVAAAQWLDANKIVDKRVVDVKDASGKLIDRKLSDYPGAYTWGRFIQIGGTVGEAIYQDMLTLIEKQNPRSITRYGKSYTFYDDQNAKDSYDPTKAGQPIFAIYDDYYPQMRYRYLYSFENSDSTKLGEGVYVYKSLNALRRCNYQFMGSWGETPLKVTYPAWLRKWNVNEDDPGADNTPQGISYEISKDTYISSNPSSTYLFQNGVSVSNAKSKAYAAGQGTTIKYSAGVQYTVTVPEDMTVTAMNIYGYANYASDAPIYVSEVNGKNYSDTENLFIPKDDDGTIHYVSHDIKLDTPARSVTFTVSGKQVCLIISITVTSASGISNTITMPISDNSQCVYTIDGRKVSNNSDASTIKSLKQGVYLVNGKKIMKK